MTSDLHVIVSMERDKSFNYESQIKGRCSELIHYGAASCMGNSTMWGPGFIYKTQAMLGAELGTAGNPQLSPTEQLSFYNCLLCLEPFSNKQVLAACCSVAQTQC